MVIFSKAIAYSPYILLYSTSTCLAHKLESRRPWCYVSYYILFSIINTVILIGIKLLKIEIQLNKQVSIVFFGLDVTVGSRSWKDCTIFTFVDFNLTVVNINQTST